MGGYYPPVGYDFPENAVLDGPHIIVSHTIVIFYLRLAYILKIRYMRRKNMKKYRAVVIDFKKFLKGGMTIVLSVAVAISSLYSAYQRFSNDGGMGEEIVRQSIATDAYNLNNGIFYKCINAVYRWASGVVFGFVPTDSESVIEGTIVFCKVNCMGQENNGIILHRAESLQNNVFDTKEWEASIPEEKRAPIKSINAAQRSALSIGNETSYSIDLSTMLESKPVFDLSGSGPKILITHTHATESYAPRGAEIYDVTASDRNEDKSQNVVAVGRRMKEVFESYGIETIHDEVLHDAPSFNGSYAHSLNTVEDYIEKYPSIQIVFDIHRDSIVYDDSTKAKTVTKISGEDAAQLMFVVGTDANGLEHPNWRANMKSAVWFQKVISEKHPTLMRHINLRKERFNGHTTGASMIIETGTSGNSLDEALYGIELATEALAQWLTKSKL